MTAQESTAGHRAGRVRGLRVGWRPGRLAGVMDFGNLLRELIRERGLSGRAVARLVPCDPALVSRLASGRKQPSERMASRLDEVLGASGLLVTAAAARAGSAVARPVAALPDDGLGDDDVNRRSVLGAMAVAPLALSLEQIRRHLDGVSAAEPGERDADEWERVVAGYARRVPGSPAAAYLPHLLADAGEVTERVMSASGGVRVRLTRSAAQIAALTAVGLSALGDDMTAVRWWRTSARVAGESGDGELVALVLGKQAAHALYSPGGEMEALARAGHALAAAPDRACAGAVFAYAARAQAYGGLGRRADAVAAAADHKRAWERLPDADVKAADSEFGQPERRVRHTQAWVLAKVGQPGAALAAIDAYLSGPVSVAGRARIELLRAETLIRGGDVDGGAGHCVTVLAGLPGAWRGEREIVSSARSALAAVPLPLCSRLPVREAREILAIQS